MKLNHVFSFFFYVVLLLITVNNFTFSQTNLVLRTGEKYFSEEEIYLDSAGQRYSTLVKVKFDKKIIDLPAGISIANVNNVNSAEIRNFFNLLKNKYGELSLIKSISSSFWGDTVRLNKRTGLPVIVKDMSQLFKIKFSRLVPIDSIISKFKGLNDVLYVCGPLEAESLIEPNDYFYVNGNQWGLGAISASPAWDITLGNPNITISTNDVYDQSITSMHPDLDSKIIYHLGYFGGHGAGVAGIAAAETNNDLGIASLGWNIKLMLDNMGSSSIQYAIDRGADVINFSWRTYPVGTNPPDLNEAIRSTLVQGVVCVAGAGNTYYPWEPQPPQVNYPSAYNFQTLEIGQVIAVSATQIYLEYGEHFAYS